MFIGTVESFIDHHTTTTMTLHMTLLILIFPSILKRWFVKFNGFFVKYFYWQAPKYIFSISKEKAPKWLGLFLLKLVEAAGIESSATFPIIGKNKGFYNAQLQRERLGNVPHRFSLNVQAFFSRKTVLRLSTSTRAYFLVIVRRVCPRNSWTTSIPTRFTASVADECRVPW